MLELNCIQLYNHQSQSLLNESLASGKMLELASKQSILITVTADWLIVSTKEWFPWLQTS